MAEQINAVDLKQMLKEFFDEHGDYEGVNEIQDIIAELTGVEDNPISSVKWVPLEKVRANSYNPNTVATEEMKLLYKSIKEDGYTQPVVTVYDEEDDEYEIVDGFHRYMVMRRNEDIAERSDGYLPITVIDSEIKERMASTVRHNRARGEHGVDDMGELVIQMLDKGWSDQRICSELGMEAEELARLKHVTGFSKLFDDIDYSMAWKTTQQIDIMNEYERRKSAEEEAEDEEVISADELRGNQYDDIVTPDEYRDLDFVRESIKTPSEDWPTLIIIFSPNRSGSTPTMYLVSSQEGVDSLYWQPIKTLLRHGEEYGIPDFSDSGKIACVKETIGPHSDKELFDPVEVFTDLGCPEENIRLVCLVRKPLEVYTSSLKFKEGIDPDEMVREYKFVEEVYEKYSGDESKVFVLPIGYESLKLATHEKTIESLGLEYEDNEFDKEKIDRSNERFYTGSLQNDVIWKSVGKPPLDQEKFKRVQTRKASVSSIMDFADLPGASDLTEKELIEAADHVEKNCSDVYDRFSSLFEKFIEEE